MFSFFCGLILLFPDLEPARRAAFLAEDGARPVRSRKRYSVSFSGRDGRTLAAAPGCDALSKPLPFERGSPYMIGSCRIPPKMKHPNPGRFFCFLYFCVQKTHLPKCEHSLFFGSCRSLSLPWRFAFLAENLPELQKAGHASSPLLRLRCTTLPHQFC